MKKQYLNIKKRVESTTRKWQTRMGLDHIEIEHVFLDSYFDGDSGNDDFKITAVTETRWNYLEARIKWFLPSASRHTLTKIEEVLVHELCHVLLAPEQDLIRNRLDLDDAKDKTVNQERNTTADLLYERMELATELTARAIWNAWH